MLHTLLLIAIGMIIGGILVSVFYEDIMKKEKQVEDKVNNALTSEQKEIQRRLDMAKNEIKAKIKSGVDKL